MPYTIGTDSFGEDTDGPPDASTRWGDRVGLLPNEYLYAHDGFLVEDLPETGGGSLNPFTGVYGKA